MVEGAGENGCEYMTGGAVVIDPDDIVELQTLIRRHHALTGSDCAKEILDNMDVTLPRCVKVVFDDHGVCAKVVAGGASGYMAGRGLVVTWSRRTGSGRL